MLYRGREGMWSWIFHRLTGVGVLLFLVLHILDTMLVMWGPATYNHMVSLYKQPFFRPLEIALFAAVLYHALNGVRITIIDFWDDGATYQRQLFYGVMVLFTLLFLPGTYFMVRSLF